MIIVSNRSGHISFCILVNFLYIIKSYRSKVVITRFDKKQIV